MNAEFYSLVILMQQAMTTDTFAMWQAEHYDEDNR